ncbi:peptidoglycan-binding protein [Ilumatobacter sp.]|uniref:peptidoglycan-binding protein n=1 Tax=Ilumatobacter sp. TaxID=1967498 RepID=UPI003B51B1E0
MVQLQQALIEGGAYLPGGADGVFGPATTSAIESFQTWNALPRTGSLDATTVRRLGLSSNDTSSTSRSPYAELAPGSRGRLVVDVQHALLATGLVIHGGADGVFGPATRRALKAFQRVNGMSETGEMSERAARLLDPAAATGSPDRDQRASSRSTNAPTWTHLERFPVQGTCAYGDTWHAPRSDGRVHEGIDFIAATGNLLYAVSDGTITTQYLDGVHQLSGNGLILTADDGTYFVYLHLSAFAPGVTLGSEVETGDVIGYVGDTGSSATPHLHFEIHPGGGAAINPYPYVRAIDACDDTRARHPSPSG